jgi:hypothetical protein
MDYRFLAAGIVAAALGYMSGSVVFADAPRPVGDPALVRAANDRAELVGALAVPLPPAADLPPLPRLPATPELPDVAAVRRAARPKVRYVVVRRVTPATPVRRTAKRRPPAQREPEHEHEGSDHERGDD